MKAIIGFAVAVAVVVAATIPSSGRVHPQMYCWIPDSEFPVICEEEEEEDYERNPSARKGYTLMPGAPEAGTLVGFRGALERERHCAVFPMSAMSRISA